MEMELNMMEDIVKSIHEEMVYLRERQDNFKKFLSFLTYEK